MIGTQIHEFAKKLWPINRSITGEGVRETLKQIQYHIAEVKIKSVPSGTAVFDWIIPREWYVNEAYIITPSGKKICDFNNNNLHLVGYSVPFTGEIDLAELKAHLYTLPDQKDAIPYITSYYDERWGFCLTHDQYNQLEEGSYFVKVDTKLFDGELNYGELILPGKSSEEVFISTYICHPSMANNELSGPAVVTYLAKWLTQIEALEYTYRIIFIPETIGSITYLSQHHEIMKKNIFAGFNVSCIGDNRSYSYLPSRNGKTYSDEIAKHVLKWTDKKFRQYSWYDDRGSDERQYCAPGLDLPIASIMRTKFGEYPEYHTSLDDLEQVVTPDGLEGGYQMLRRAIEVIEKNRKYKIQVLGEPQLGKRGLYPAISSKKTWDEVKLKMNFLSECDGATSLLQIAENLDTPIWELYDIADIFLGHGLIKIND
ncbi:MAG TPA: aminopeptidase [Rhodobacteraceae bacterium]|nr:aminopeptidase [Paracoccaceae bacterium]